MIASAAAHRCAIFAGPSGIDCCRKQQAAKLPNLTVPPTRWPSTCQHKVSFDLVRKKKTRTHTRTHTLLDVRCAMLLFCLLRSISTGSCGALGVHHFQPAYVHITHFGYMYSAHHVWYCTCVSMREACAPVAVPCAKRRYTKVGKPGRVHGIALRVACISLGCRAANQMAPA